MKKFVLIAVFFATAFSAFAFDFYKAAESETVYKDLNKMLEKDFSGKKMMYAHVDGLSAMVNAVSMEERETLFKQHQKAKMMYVGLNALLPSLGSFIQGDVYGGVSTVVGLGIGVGFAAGGYLGYLISGLAYAMSAIDNPDGVNQTQMAIVALPSLFMVAAGGIIATSTSLYSLFRPISYANGFNRELANILGVSDVKVGAAPYITSDGKAAGASVAVAIRL